MLFSMLDTYTYVSYLSYPYLHDADNILGVTFII